MPKSYIYSKIHKTSPFSPGMMVRDNETVIEFVVFDPDPGTALTQIREFNELVNMTAGELEAWLREEQSQDSG